MTSRGADRGAPVVDQSFEVAGGAAETIGFGLDGLSHAGPLAVIVGVVALVVMAPVMWLRRRGNAG